jgi:hypothetical protein
LSKVINFYVVTMLLKLHMLYSVALSKDSEEQTEKKNHCKHVRVADNAPEIQTGHLAKIRFE